MEPCEHCSGWRRDGMPPVYAALMIHDQSVCPDEIPPARRQVRTPITVRFGQEYHFIGSCNRDDIPMFVAEFKDRVQSWDELTARLTEEAG